MATQDTTFVPNSTNFTAQMAQPLNDSVWKGRNPIYTTSTGSGSAYVVTLPAGSLANTIAPGDRFTWKAHTTNTGPATLTIVGSSSLGAKPLNNGAGVPLTIGQLPSGTIVTATYDGNAFQITIPTSSGGGGGGSTYTQPGIGGITRTFDALIQDDAISVKNFGAIGDGVADDTIALQAAINYGVLKKITIFLPAGTYKITSGLVIDNNTPTDPLNVGAFSPHMSLLGSGSSITRIKATGNFTAISIGAGNYFEPLIRLNGIYLEGTSKNGIGVSLNMVILFQMDDVITTNFNTGITAVNCLGGELHRVLSDHNSYGVILNSGVYTGPNAFNFNFCKIAENDNLGIKAIDAVTLLITGGAIEANGLLGADAFKGGIYCIPGMNGVAGITCSGVYFEANKGQADVYLDEINTSSSANAFVGCTFNRLSNTAFVTNNIAGFAASGKTLTVSVIGCGFQNYGDYVPSSSREYLKSLGGDVRFSWSGCFMGSTIEYPATRNFTGGIRSIGNNNPVIQGDTDGNPSLTTITFPVPFTQPPGVFLQSLNFDPSGGLFYTAELAGLPTATSFQVRKTVITRATGLFSDSSHVIEWIAFGNGYPNV